jgi:heat shock protein HslJ
MQRSRLAMAFALSTFSLAVLPVVATAQDGAAASIEGPVWDLVVPDDRLAGTGATLALQGGTASVHGGCNTFFGGYELDGSSLAFGELAGTQVACGPAETEVEAFFLGGLGEVASYDILEDGTLELLDADGNAVLTFSEEVAATTTELGEVEFELERMRGHIAELRERLSSHVADLREEIKQQDTRDDVAALEAHLNELTKQHLHQRDLLHQLTKRTHALEKQVAILTEIHAEAGDIPTVD